MRTVAEIKESPIVTRVLNEMPDGIALAVKLPHFKGTVIASWGMGWDHVSVAPLKRYITPDWDDMCIIKREFFLPEETVIEYHPAEPVYVDMVPNCLHLWRPQTVPFPVPPVFMV